MLRNKDKTMTEICSRKDWDFVKLSLYHLSICGFSSRHVWMWESDHKESWAPKIDAFELWCWRRVQHPWDPCIQHPWESLGLQDQTQSILKEIRPEYSLEGLMLKLKLQYFGHLMWRADSLQKTEGRRKRGRQRTRWLDGITNSMDTSLSKLWSWWWTGKPGVLQSTGLQRSDTTERLNWTWYHPLHVSRMLLGTTQDCHLSLLTQSRQPREKSE